MRFPSLRADQLQVYRTDATLIVLSVKWNGRADVSFTTLTLNAIILRKSDDCSRVSDTRLTFWLVCVRKRGGGRPRIILPLISADNSSSSSCITGMQKCFLCARRHDAQCLTGSPETHLSGSLQSTCWINWCHLYIILCAPSFRLLY